jgi:tetratricopeptide (TPR) repeat protein
VTGGLAFALMCEGQLDTAERLGREALSTFRSLGDREGVAAALDTVAWVASCQGKYADSQTLFEERLAVVTDLGLSPIWCLSGLGWAKMQQGQYGAAREDLASGLKLAAEEGALLMTATYSALLGRLAVYEGAYAEARRLCSEGIAGFEAGDSTDNAFTARGTLGYAELALGETDNARTCAVEALTWVRDHGTFPVLFEVLPLAAQLLLAEGETERAVEIYEMACTLPAVSNSQWVADVVGRPISEAAAALPPAVVAAAKERGRARDVQAALKELIAESEGCGSL